MANFSKGLAKLGKRDGVNVSSVHPGTTDTERTHEFLAQRAAASGRPVEELRREMLARHGLGHPDDIAALALFPLCAERAGRHNQYWHPQDFGYNRLIGAASSFNMYGNSRKGGTVPANPGMIVDVVDEENKVVLKC